MALSACASDSGQLPPPSLAIRDIERVSGQFEVETQPESSGPSPTSMETLADVESLLVRAQDSHKEFLAAVPGAERAVRAAGAGPESNSWASAQVALADLDSHRSVTAIALGEIDLFYVDATLNFVQRERIADVRESVVEIVEEEDSVLARLHGSLIR